MTIDLCGARLWAALVAASMIVAGAGASLAQSAASGAETLLGQAKALAEGTEAPYDAEESRKLQEARHLLDRIVTDYPTDQLAMRILFQETIDGLDIAALDAAIEQAAETDAASETATPLPTGSEIAIVPLTAIDENSVEEEVAAPEPVSPPQTVTSEAPPETGDSAPPGLRRVGQCFVADVQTAESSEIIVSVELDAAGNVAALPELVEPKAPSARDRTLFVNVITALDQCAPYGPDSAGTHRLAASGDSIRRLDPSGPEAASADAAPKPAIEPAIEPALSSASGMAPLTLPGTSPNWVPANAETHAALKLSRREVAELQARLNAMGYDPNGIDGLSGKGTRNAISLWQENAGIPVTGYLDGEQIDALIREATPAYTEWLKDDANRDLVQAASAPPKPANASKKTNANRKDAPPGYFWYKGRLCRRVFGNAVISCK